MKAVKVVVFSIIMFALIYPTLISKEFLDVRGVVWIQSVFKNSMYGPLYSDNGTYYKYLSSIENAPDIMALGTSRVLQIKEQFFTDPDSFYNAGYAVENIDEFSNFIINLENLVPETLIISLDQNFFNEGWNTSTEESFFEYEEINSKPIDFKHTLTNVSSSLLAGKYNYSDFLASPLDIGINAQINNHGFLNDGSYHYGHVYNDGYSDYERVENALINISNSELRFQHGEFPNKNSFEMIDNFLSLCEEKGVSVVAYLPPFPPSVNEKMAEGGYQYLDTVPDELKKIFDAYSFEFYDYTDVTNLGCDDSYFIDGLHAGAVVHVRMQIDMIEKGSILSRYSDISLLTHLDNNKTSNLDLGI